MRLLIASLICSAVAFGCSWSYGYWIQRSFSADALYRFERNGKAGYIDRDGIVVIKPQFDGVTNSNGEFHDGLLAVDSPLQFVERSGKKAFDIAFRIEGYFSEGLASVRSLSTQKLGFIDKKGKLVIPARFSGIANPHAPLFSEGLAAVAFGGKTGYIDKTGAFVIQPRFLEGMAFHEGLARVVLDGPCRYIPDTPCAEYDAVGLPRGLRLGPNVRKCKFSFSDREGKSLSLSLELAKDFSEGLAAAKLDGKWGYIDKQGRWVIAPQFVAAQPFSNGLALVGRHPEYGYIDKRGVYVIEARFRRAESFSDGLAAVGNDKDGYWYIDKTGARAFAGNFVFASPFFKGLAHVEEMPRNEAGRSNRVRRFAYIRVNGKRVFEYQ